MLSVLRSTGLKLCSGIGLVLCIAVAAAAAPAPTLATPKAESALNAGKKWETDTAIRQGMENIRQAMVESQTRITAEQLSAQDYQQLARKLDKNMADIEKNKTITKEAKTAFHLVIMIDLKQSVAMMRTGATVKLQRVGALGALQSLRLYGEYFQHPGWV